MNNISQYLFYCIFDQINTALVGIKDFNFYPENVSKLLLCFFFCFFVMHIFVSCLYFLNSEYSNIYGLAPFTSFISA